MQTTNSTPQRRPPKFSTNSKPAETKAAGTLLLGERLTLRLGGEDGRDDADEEDGAHGHRGVAERERRILRGVSAVHIGRQFCREEAAGGGGEASEIIAEARAGAAQAAGEKLGQVDGL